MAAGSEEGCQSLSGMRGASSVGGWQRSEMVICRRINQISKYIKDNGRQVIAVRVRVRIWVRVSDRV